MIKADVSVIVPCFNADKTLSRAIKSVISQTMLPNEIVVVDDGSASTAYLEKLQTIIGDLTKFKIIKLGRNMGVSYARNVGICESESSYIAFLDADDYWHPEKIEVQFTLTSDLQYKISAHQYISNLNTKHIPTGKKITYNTINYKRLLFKNYFATPTVMALKSDFILFDESLRRMEDHKCWIENTLISPALLINSPLAGGFKMPLGEAGLSKNIPAMHEGAMQVFKKLKRDKKISCIEYLLASSFEQLKYLYRRIRMRKTAH